MDGIVPYAIWAVLIISGLSLVAILLFGLRGLSYGKMDPLTLVLLALPVLLVVILGFTMNSWAEAAIVTFLIELVLTALSLLLSSLRGLIGM